MKVHYQIKQVEKVVCKKQTNLKITIHITKKINNKIKKIKNQKSKKQKVKKNKHQINSISQQFTKKKY